MPNYHGTPSKFGNWLIPVKALTGTTYTVTTDDLGKCLTNRGVNAMAITLPDPATLPMGSWVMVYAVATGDFSVGCTNKIVCLNKAAADAVGWTTDGEEIGNGALFVNLGTLWFAEMAVADEANTMTVTSA
jgi:hypothetical protein